MTEPASPGQDPQGTRLQKVLARLGFGSRRACEELIASGRVRVDGAPAALGQRIDPATQRVEVDGVVVASAPGLVYYLVNKPRGVITTAKDTHGRPVATDLVPQEPRVFPVGRLDADTEGLLLLTNDGDLAFWVAHPSHGVEKEYLVQTESTPGPGALRALREGIELEDGSSAPCKVGVLSVGVLRIVVHEGRNRQVRRMCEAIGHPVTRLVRTRLGPICDPGLAPGAWRKLEPWEVRSLEVAARGPVERAAGEP
ncbi:MAG: pseudouridine synthase [Acidimicrobiales bacterium]